MDVPAATVPETIISTSSSPGDAGSRYANDPVARGFREAPFSPERGGVRELYR